MGYRAEDRHMSDTNDTDFEGTDGDAEGHGTPGKPRVKVPEEIGSTESDAEGHIAVNQQPGKPRVKVPGEG
jgi:hypothetical protein